MKRIEMIEILRASITKHFEDMTCCSSDEEALSDILQDLEDAGMAPPYRDRYIEGHLCDDQSWEPELSLEEYKDARNKGYIADE